MSHQAHKVVSLFAAAGAAVIVSGFSSKAQACPCDSHGNPITINSGDNGGNGDNGNNGGNGGNGDNGNNGGNGGNGDNGNNGGNGGNSGTGIAKAAGGSAQQQQSATSGAAATSSGSPVNINTAGSRYTYRDAVQLGGVVGGRAPDVITVVPCQDTTATSGGGFSASAGPFAGIGLSGKGKAVSTPNEGCEKEHTIRDVTVNMVQSTMPCGAKDAFAAYAVNLPPAYYATALASCAQPAPAQPVQVKVVYVHTPARPKKPVCHEELVCKPE